MPEPTPKPAPQPLATAAAPISATPTPGGYTANVRAPAAANATSHQNAEFKALTDAFDYAEAVGNPAAKQRAAQLLTQKNAEINAAQRAAAIPLRPKPQEAPFIQKLLSSQQPTAHTTEPAPKPAAAPEPAARAPQYTAIRSAVAAVTNTEVGAKALGAAGLVTTVGVGGAQLLAGDTKGAGGTFASVDGALVGGTVFGNLPALVQSARNFVASGSMQLANSAPHPGAKFALSTLGIAIGGIGAKEIYNSLTNPQNTPQRPIPTTQSTSSSIPAASPWLGTPLGDALDRLVPKREDKVRIREMIDATPGGDLAAKQATLRMQLAPYKRITGTPDQEIRAQEQLLTRALAVVSDAEQVTKARAAAVAPAPAPAPVVAAAPVAAKPGKVLHIAEVDETLTSIAQREEFTALRALVRKELRATAAKYASEHPEEKTVKKITDPEVLNAAAFVLMLNEGSAIARVDAVKAGQAIHAVSPEAVKEAFVKLQACHIVSPQGHISPSATPRDHASIQASCPTK